MKIYIGRLIALLTCLSVAASCTSHGSRPSKFASPTSTPAAIPASTPDVQATLNAFLAAMQDGDQTAMAKYATQDVIESIENAGGRSLNYSLVWGDRCALDPLGTGQCEVLVIDPHLPPASIYSLHYAVTASGLLITGFKFAGDAG